MVIPPFGLRVIRQMLQPRPYSGGIRQPPMRLEFPRSQLFTDIPWLINDAESRLVGQIIADKTGSRPANGASCMNAVIASPLLTPRGLISTTHLPAVTPAADSAEQSAAPAPARRSAAAGPGDSGARKPSLYSPAHIPGALPAPTSAQPRSHRAALSAEETM